MGDSLSHSCSLPLLQTLFLKKIIELTHLSPDEIFVDIGHGAGNAVLQAALTVGCESRGIEVVPERCRVPELFEEVMHEMADEIMANFGFEKVGTHSFPII